LKQLEKVCTNVILKTNYPKRMYKGYTLDLLIKKYKIHILLTNKNTCE